MAKSKGKNQWVVPVGEDKWGVRGEGNEKLTKITDTKEQATNTATDIAKNQGSDVIVQNRDGKISDRDSYGNDPCPPKDTKH